jgi:hypothetical protein
VEKRITHSCGCNPRRPCHRARQLFERGQTNALEKHLEDTMRVDGTPVWHRSLTASLGEISGRARP